ncbi:MAG: MFS transporter [Pseudomonadota bacterium]
MSTDISSAGPLRSDVRTIFAWSAIALLCALYMLSFVDRMILALLVEPITQDLGVSDTQVGFLIGIGFALVYVLVGLPIAHIVDAGARRAILVGGVILWSLATIGSAFSDNFLHLAIGRLGVAIGEASLTPVAIAAIADMFPRERRETPTSVYMAVGVLMGSGAFILGGVAVQFAGHVSTFVSLEVWRLTLIIVGLPGIPLALLALWLIGPARERQEASVSNVSAAEALSYLINGGRFFLLLFLSVGCASILGMGAGAWLPTLLVREFDFEVASAGLLFGAVGVPSGVLGTVLAPVITKQLSERFGKSSIPLVVATCSIAGSASLGLGLLSGELPFLLAGVAGALFFLSGAIVMPAIIIQSLSPALLRARLMATNLLCLGLLGQGVGPVLVAGLGEATPGESSLSFGLMATATVSAALASLFAWLMHARLRSWAPQPGAEDKDVLIDHG